MTALNFNKFEEFYKPGYDLAVNEMMTGLKSTFISKQYMPGKPTKWGMKA